jgi:hypothetical protein
MQCQPNAHEVEVEVEEESKTKTQASPDGSASVDEQNLEPDPGNPTGSKGGVEATLGLIVGLAESKSLAGTPAGNPALQPAWTWLKANTSPEQASAVMRFVGWLVKTGTRDAPTLLALAKHMLVHKPENPHAYYTSNGVTRHSIARQVALDRAVAEHERIKREERAFLGRG